MNISHYLERGQKLLATGDGLSQAENAVKEAMATLDASRAAMTKATERLGTMNKRLTELNGEVETIKGHHRKRELALVDEYVCGCAPLDDFSATYDKLSAESRFLLACIQRTVEHHLRNATRDVLVAQVAEKRAEFELADSQSVLAMVKRLFLAGPLIEHEGSIQVSGGATESAIQRAADAFREYTDLEAVLAERDAAWTNRV